MNLRNLWNRLTINEQTLLTYLSPFNGGISISEPLFKYYFEWLTKNQVLPVKKEISIEEVFSKLEVLGCISSPTNIGGYSFVFLASDWSLFLKSIFTKQLAPSIQKLVKASYVDYFNQAILPYFNQVLNNVTDVDEHQLVIDWVTLEYANIEHVLALSLELNQDALLPFWVLDRYNKHLQHHEERKFTCNKVLKIARKKYTNEEHVGSLIALVDGIGHIYSDMGYHEDAQTAFFEALNIYERQADTIPYKKALLYNNIGFASLDLETYEVAENYLLKAFRIFEEEGTNEQALANAAVNLGSCYMELKRIEESNQYYYKALQLYEKLGDMYAQLEVYWSLGVSAHKQGNYEKSKAGLLQCLTLALELNDRANAAMIYRQLGRVSMDLNVFEESESFFKSALSLYIEGNRSYAEGETYQNLASLKLNQELYEESEDYYHMALKIFKAYEDEAACMILYMDLGLINFIQEYPDESLDFYHKALVIAMDREDTSNEALIQHNIGNVYYFLEEYSIALKHYEKAEGICEETGNIVKRAEVFQNIGNIYSKLKAYKISEEHYKTAIDLIGNITEEEQLLKDIWHNVKVLGTVSGNDKLVTEAEGWISSL